MVVPAPLAPLSGLALLKRQGEGYAGRTHHELITSLALTMIGLKTGLSKLPWFNCYLGLSRIDIPMSVACFCGVAGKGSFYVRRFSSEK